MSAGSSRADRATEINLWHSKTGRQLFSFTTEASPGGGLAVNSVGGHVAWAGLDGTVKLRHCAKNSKRLSVAAHADRVNCLAFTPSGELLISGSEDNTVTVTDVRSNSSENAKLLRLFTDRGSNKCDRKSGIQPKGQENFYRRF